MICDFSSDETWHVVGAGEENKPRPFGGGQLTVRSSRFAVMSPGLIEARALRGDDLIRLGGIEIVVTPLPDVQPLRIIHLQAGSIPKKMPPTEATSNAG